MPEINRLQTANPGNLELTRFRPRSSEVSGVTPVSSKEKPFCFKQPPALLIRKEHFRLICKTFGRDAKDVIALEIAYMELGWDRPLEEYKRQANILEPAWSRIKEKLRDVFSTDRPEAELVIPHLIENMKKDKAKY